MNLSRNGDMVTNNSKITKHDYCHHYFEIIFQEEIRVYFLRRQKLCQALADPQLLVFLVPFSNALLVRQGRPESKIFDGLYSMSLIVHFCLTISPINAVSQSCELPLPNIFQMS